MLLRYETLFTWHFTILTRIICGKIIQSIAINLSLFYQSTLKYYHKYIKSLRNVYILSSFGFKRYNKCSYKIKIIKPRHRYKS